LSILPVLAKLAFTAGVEVLPTDIIIKCWHIYILSFTARPACRPSLKKNNPCWGWYIKNIINS